MFTKNALIGLCAAATISQAAAGIVHRHAHPLVKKAIQTDVVVVTDWVTVFVTEGQEEVAAATAAVAAAAIPPPAPAIGGVYEETTVVAASASTVAAAAVNTAPAAVAVATTFTQIVKPAEPSVQGYPVQVEPSVQGYPVQVVSSVQAPPVQVVPTLQVPTTAQATTTAQAPTTVISSTAPVATGSGNKRGLAYNSISLLTTFSSVCSWAYNWNSVPDGTLPPGMIFVPMLWGTGSDKTQNWIANANAAIAAGSTHLMSFNEPDNHGQANLSPAAASTGHQQWMNQFSGKAKIGAPAISSQADPGFGLDWFRQFKESCNGACAYDFCNVHWYGGAEEPQNFIKFVEDSVTACEGKPVWVTEFAPTGTDEDANAEFVQTVIPQLDALAGVERYSYFMLSKGSLMSATSDGMSKIGNAYLAA